MLRGGSRWASRFKIFLPRLKNDCKTPPFLLTFSSSFTTTTPTAGTGAADNDSSQPGRPSAPPPIQVGFTDSAGRGVFATRRIAAGELIHTAKPIVCHPSLSSLHSVCYFCLRKLLPDQRPLFQSNDVQFCSQECQNQSQVEKEFCLLRNTFQDADINTQQLAFLTKQWYTGVLARIRINAFRVELACESYEDLLSSAAASVEAEGAVGNAIYMLPSFYNHDCDPNAHILWPENVDARVKALCDIEAGEELRICYIDASMDYEARQTILSKGFGFQCNCLRCSSHH
ncbi:histone-lysine N-methyltransferase ATXR4 isoform X2 [Coffea eugenioides]|uniref:Histone-lysine N-methyltransferase ATXR4-like isoform X2 n=1 Tax=Coffea arabica TaxID=13443 RepID=A0A6P6SXD9_COFAR|nr:histone-lysine N-methyltransferase ATXR4-like isoform X2 [Coffea arabica]XP_027176892.1 histone-lysine N-methyltransferase ATXR4 isoform X2 [Coffea eugenioides]